MIKFAPALTEKQKNFEEIKKLQEENQKLLSENLRLNQQLDEMSEKNESFVKEQILLKQKIETKDSQLLESEVCSNDINEETDNKSFVFSR